jgi:hypothetical protein
MELKTSIVLEVKKDERLYQLFLPNGAPFGEACDAASEMVSALLKLATENHEKTKEKCEAEISTSKIEGENNKKA